MGRYYDDGWPRYVTVAERRRRAAQKVARMKKAGREVSPVEITGRKIAATFWGGAWCNNLEAYSDYENRLPRGRTYVRNGSVIDLQVEAGHVHALVSGTDLYTVDVKIKPLPGKKWRQIKGQCAGQIDSLVELLQGSISRGVMEIVTRKGEGLFPSPREITLACSCPDWATMCKHVAATLYGVGARLDHDPELLFTLRGVDPTEMVEAAIDQPAAAGKAPGGRVLPAGELSSVFGIDIDMDGVPPGGPPAPTAPARRTRRADKPRRSARPGARKEGAGARPPARRAAAAGKSAARPKMAKLSGDLLLRLQDRTVEFVEASTNIREIVEEVQLARGRLYLWRDRERGDLMARITPLNSRSMLLETPRRRAWSEQKRGLLTTVLKHLDWEAEAALP